VRREHILQPGDFLQAWVRWTTHEQRGRVDMVAVLDAAEAAADQLADEWPEDCGFGSSDRNATFTNFLRGLGYKVEVVNNRYTVTGHRADEETP
jgi:hypothetical protein